jgi:hypothetical protein
VSWNARQARGAERRGSGKLKRNERPPDWCRFKTEAKATGRVSAKPIGGQEARCSPVSGSWRGRPGSAVKNLSEPGSARCSSSGSLGAVDARDGQRHMGEAASGRPGVWFVQCEVAPRKAVQTCWLRREVVIVRSWRGMSELDARSGLDRTRNTRVVFSSLIGAVSLCMFMIRVFTREPRAHKHVSKSYIHPLSRNFTGTSTTRLRRYSATPFPRMSIRELLDIPPSRNLRTRLGGC